MTNRLAHHYVTMAFNNAWANHRLLGAVAELSDEDFRAPRVGFFPSLKGTLNHNVTVDWFYVDALERAVNGQPVNAAARAFFDPEEPFDACGPLREAQREVDRRLLTLCRGLDDATLDVPVAIQRPHGVAYDDASRILAHLFQHQIHHRGQAHAMLSSTRVAPPQLDEFFCQGDAPLRVKDLAELGFSEEMIWTRG